MAKFESRDEELFIDGRKVLRAWESFNGWYWFGIEEAYTQDSMIKGEVYEDDQIWYGYVQGHDEEWGYFSETELELMRPRIWEIPQKNLPWSGRRDA